MSYEEPPLPGDEDVAEAEARRLAMDDQLRRHRETDASMLGHFRNALLAEGFSDKGAEQVVVAFYYDWLNYIPPPPAD